MKTNNNALSTITVSFEEIKNLYNANQCWGISSGIDLHECKPEIIRSTALIHEYVIKLCELIDMKRFQETKIIHFGDDERIAGFSMTQLIETSLVSGHFANSTNAAYIDIFSCKLYNPYTALDFTQQFFHARESSLNIMLRK